MANGGTGRLDVVNLPSGINSDHRVFSNLYADYFITQQTLHKQSKNLLIDGLRKIFKNDNLFTYREDEFGFPLTVDNTDKDIDGSDVTKLLISDLHRYEVKHFPAITVRNNGSAYKPISFNQNGTLKYRRDLVEDDNGSRRIVNTPTHRVYSGIWEGDFEVGIFTESQSELEELTDIVAVLLQHTLREDLRANGLFIKPIRIGGESTEPFANAFIYSQKISIPTLSEWAVEIPLDNLIEKIVFYFEVTLHPIPGQATQGDLLRTSFEEILQITELTT